MKRRTLTVLAAGAALGAIALTGASGAQAAGSSGSGSTSLPPVCVKQALPSPAPAGWQIEVGYCPAG